MSRWAKAMIVADSAGRERQAILRKVRRMKKRMINGYGCLDDLEKFILTRDDIYSRRKGDLGKK